MFLEALMEGSPKTYDTPPFYGDQKVSVTTKKRWLKKFQMLQGWQKFFNYHKGMTKFL
jgi:hypothetical protein